MDDKRLKILKELISASELLDCEIKTLEDECERLEDLLKCDGIVTLSDSVRNRIEDKLNSTKEGLESLKKDYDAL